MQEILLSWRVAIQADLQTARADLVTGTRAVAAAEIEVAEAKRERAALAAAVARLGQNPTISGALHGRIRKHDEELSQVSGRLVRAKHEAANCRARIADLEAALEQLDRMAPVEIEVAA